MNYKVAGKFLYNDIDVNGRPVVRYRENAANPERYTRHPLFGRMYANVDNKLDVSERSYAANIKDRIAGITGIKQEIVKGSNLITGLRNPGERLEAKLMDLKTINDQLSKFYIDEFNSQTNRGKSIEEADKNAQEFIKLILKYKLQEHNIDFPKDGISMLSTNLGTRGALGL